MSLRRASLILPCQRADQFPSHLTGGRASELLAEVYLSMTAGRDADVAEAYERAIAGVKSRYPSQA